METINFSNYMMQVINDLKNEERYGTAYIYGYALQAFRSFERAEDIPFTAFSKARVKRFELYLQGRRLCWNTISTYLRAVRAVYNRAVDAGIIKGEYRLFNNVFTGVTSEKKRALMAEEMQRLVDAPKNIGATSAVNASCRLLKARHLLTLMLLLQGIGFADLVHLRREELKTNSSGGHVLHFRRQKTGMEISIQVSPEAMAIINLHRSQCADSPYLLGLLDGVCTGEAAYKAYRCQLRSFNYYLARLGKLCGITAGVSSYTARHTWATLAKFCEVPEEVISEGLGHSSLDVTRTYLKRFESDKLDKANKIIIDYVLNGKQAFWGRL